MRRAIETGWGAAPPFRRGARGLMAVAALLVLAVPVRAADMTSLSCRAQVVAWCDKQCEFGAGPADVALDLTAGTISYCRGEQCDEGRIKVDHQQGQWNDEPYLSFDGDVARGGRVWGLVALKSLTFYAKGDVGSMFGTCSTP
jgi:hypothetical protein